MNGKRRAFFRKRRKNGYGGARILPLRSGAPFFFAVGGQARAA